MPEAKEISLNYLNNFLLHQSICVYKNNLIFERTYSIKIVFAVNFKLNKSFLKLKKKIFNYFTQVIPII
jgi:hypothetical protein